mgnify:FL=1
MLRRDGGDDGDVGANVAAKCSHFAGVINAEFLDDNVDVMLAAGSAAGSAQDR